MLYLFSPYLASLLLCASVVQADGTGLLGLGKWLYEPVCAHSCRLLLRDSPILCDDDGAAETETGHGNDAHHKRAHNHAMAPTAECWLLDASFLRTMALCIDEYCSKKGVEIWTIEEYWEGHLATGSIGDWSAEMRPIMTYQEALRLAHADVEEVGSDNVPYAVSGDPLNQTSFVAEDDFIPTYNYQMSFQLGEFDHGANSLAIAVTSIGIPILFSMFRFLPGYSLWSSRLNAILDQPLFGSRHRVPVLGNLGLMPTRGQSLFIGYLFLVNIFLLALPLHTMLPSSRVDNATSHQIMVVGDRAGVIAFCLYVSLFLFSSRNNILIWLTGWSHGTYLLLHRWVAYLCIFQTVIHSILLLHLYVESGEHAAESQLPYWYWGIVATLATCLILPASLLPVRQKAYQVFLATHQALVALTLIAAFLHIWYLFKYNWGYEIWIYVAGAIWFLDRALRLLRVAANGLRTAEVAIVDAESDLIRVDIDGITADGHIYLYFPTLSWRFWESHPFSVVSSFSTPSGVADTAGSADSRNESVSEHEKVATVTQTAVLQPADAVSSDPLASSPLITGPRVSVLIRPQSGATAALLRRARASNCLARLPVLVESSYHANPAGHRLSHCSTLVCIAGGVGITAVLPLARAFGGVQARVFWSVKRDDAVRALQPELKALRSAVHLETSIGKRLQVAEILREELLREGDKGSVGVVVCGPAEMADDVRRVIGELVGSGQARRGVVFVDEAFSW